MGNFSNGNGPRMRPRYIQGIIPASTRRSSKVGIMLDQGHNRGPTLYQHRQNLESYFNIFIHLKLASQTQCPASCESLMNYPSPKVYKLHLFIFPTTRLDFSRSVCDLEKPNLAVKKIHMLGSY